jgi:hypothetical protein
LPFFRLATRAVRRTWTPQFWTKSAAHSAAISNVSPLNLIFADPNEGITFNATSPAGIDDSGIGLVVNGVNVSQNLLISGSSSNKIVAYHGLQSNLITTLRLH